MESMFFFIDIILGLACLGVMIILYRTGRIEPHHWKLFWLGVLLGLAWELGCNLQMIYGNAPVARFLRPLPFPFPVIVAVHSLWDGALFMMGVWLVRRLFGADSFRRFRLRELLVFILWGQVQELAVEIISLRSGAWEWVVYPWNPALFHVEGFAITLFPQLIWLGAVLVFYPAAVRMHRSANLTGSVPAALR